MIVAIYARVSTSDQSCEMQLCELRQYVQKRCWEVFAEYVDTGFSGAAASRPQIDRLLADARLRRFEAVLVWKLDRWGRSVAHCVAAFRSLSPSTFGFSALQRVSTRERRARYLGSCCIYSQPLPRWRGK